LFVNIYWCLFCNYLSLFSSKTVIIVWTCDINVLHIAIKRLKWYNYLYFNQTVLSTWHLLSTENFPFEIRLFRLQISNQSTLFSHMTKFKLPISLKVQQFLIRRERTSWFKIFWNMNFAKSSSYDVFELRRYVANWAGKSWPQIQCKKNLNLYITGIILWIDAQESQNKW
jgi:hypothetical protein